MNGHGYAAFVVVMFEPSIHTWFKHDYDKRNISITIHYHTEYLVQTWLRQTQHIHDHSLPHRMLGSTNQVFCVVMNDHGYVSFVVVMFEPSILCGNEWSWICFVCRSHGQTKHIHDHSLPHRILGSNMTTRNKTYPWSFITTQNAWFNYDYEKQNISMIIHYHTEYLVQTWHHGYVSFVVVMFEPSILCGNEWSWICFVCRSHVWTKYSVR
jgi:hypothetical protein